MNLRYHILKWASIASGNGVYNAYQSALAWDDLSPEEVQAKQKSSLEKLLLHAYQQVPYYKETFQKCNIFRGPNKPHLSDFSRIPFLTKDIIREQFKNLLSSDWKERGGKPNTSGGSTGEPVRFIQDKGQRWWCVYANKLYYNHKLGKLPGERELVLWGSDRDILRGSIGPKARLINYFYNRKFLNAYRMSPETMTNYIQQIDKFRPISIWAYVESLELLARFAEDRNITITSPKLLISTAGTLYPKTRELIERVFKAPLYNQYGSREVGGIACQCQNQDQFHLFPWSHYVEIVDEKGNVTPPGEEGEVVITNLVNYAMPLIRYKIGDRAIQPAAPCACGRSSHTLFLITELVSEHLIALDGTYIYGGFFRLLYYNRPWVKRFQIVQTHADHVINKIVTSDPPQKADLNEVVVKWKKVLGEAVKIDFVFVEEILPSTSGKFLHVLNLVNNSRSINP